MPQVSVIVLTYNPDNGKLRQALSAIVAQKDVDLEILISDDGSARKDFSFLDGWMESVGFSNYRLLEHAQNRGTVQSCTSAVEVATGEYVFLTSPGDFLFDEYVLRDLFRFAEEAKAPLCFGNAVFYTAENGIPRLTRTVGTPVSPQLYAPGSRRAKTAFFGGSWVIGASYFRKRVPFLSNLKQISDTSKYTEDTPTTAFAMADGLPLTHFDRNVVWYEDGTGVSTGGNDKWNRLLHQDALLSFKKLKKLYPKDPHVDILYRNISESNRAKRICGNLLLHPVIMLHLLLCRRASTPPIHCTQENLDHLQSLLQTK